MVLSIDKTRQDGGNVIINKDNRITAFHEKDNGNIKGGPPPPPPLPVACSMDLPPSVSGPKSGSPPAKGGGVAKQQVVPFQKPF